MLPWIITIQYLEQLTYFQPKLFSTTNREAHGDKLQAAATLVN